MRASYCIKMLFILQVDFYYDVTSTKYFRRKRRLPLKVESKTMYSIFDDPLKEIA